MSLQLVLPDAVFSFLFIVRLSPFFPPRLSYCLSDPLMPCSVCQLGVGCQNSVTARLLELCSFGQRCTSQQTLKRSREKLKASKDNNKGKNSSHTDARTHILFQFRNTFLMVNLTCVQIINHTHRLSNSFCTAKECRE